MHPDYPTRETLRGRLLRDLRAIHTLLNDPRTGGQVLERLPSGDYAWLRPEHHSIRIVEPVALPQPDDDTRVALTDLGRRALAMEALFGPWPRLACGQAGCLHSPSYRCSVCAATYSEAYAACLFVANGRPCRGRLVATCEAC